MLKYFLPDWEDRLDPEFDFEKDSFSNGHKKNAYEHDYYAHQIFDEPPYDGILVSLAIFENKISLSQQGNEYQIRGRNNIKKYLKIPERSSLEVMGDCGAFGYVKEKEPPQPFYTVENVAQIYQRLGFDYGVSVDHLAVDYIFIKNQKTGRREKKLLSQREKNRRIKITLDNAVQFLDLHQDNNYSFVPVGVAQGYDLDTYKSSVKSLVDMGYDYIALGGLVQYSTPFIIKILEAIQPYSSKVKIHLFGVLRKDHLETFQQLGADSFDSASFFRKAWLRSGQNYLSSKGDWYSSIRVPQSSNPRVVKYADTNGFSKKDIEDMESKALNALFDYDKGLLDLDQVLETVMDYDDLLLRNTDDGKNLYSKYRRTLQDKPWRECDCPICKEIGINVLIFRGTNRNKRRGFHNLWAFRNMKEDPQRRLEMGEVKENKNLCIVPCGSKKVWDKFPEAGPTPAKDVYIGTFAKKCQEYAAKTCPDSWYILSAKYGFLSPEDIVKGPYNVTFNDKNTNPVSLKDLILQKRQKNLDQYDKIIVVAGKIYKNIIREVFQEKEVENPLEGCRGIGFMMGRLNELIKA